MVASARSLMNDNYFVVPCLNTSVFGAYFTAGHDELPLFHGTLGPIYVPDAYSMAWYGEFPWS